MDKKKLTREERKLLYEATPAGNKYMVAARIHQGEVWVDDVGLLW